MDFVLAGGTVFLATLLSDFMLSALRMAMKFDSFFSLRGTDFRALLPPAPLILSIKALRCGSRAAAAASGGSPGGNSPGGGGAGGGGGPCAGGGGGAGGARGAHAPPPTFSRGN